MQDAIRKSVYLAQKGYFRRTSLLELHADGLWLWWHSWQVPLCLTELTEPVADKAL